MRNAVFVGRLVRDPSKAKNGSVPVAIAVNESFKNKESGEYENRSYFITSWAYGKTGEYAANNLRKGDLLSVEARVGTRTNDQGHTEGYDFTVSNLKRVYRAADSAGETITTEEVPF